MNCSEVMTLMQRQLDHDLDELEHSLLTEHISQCPACAEMFERLTMLHDDLEMLPKVTPRYSLVDSILPQLDEIDRRNSDQQAAALASSDELYKQERSDNVQVPKSTRPSSGLWKKRFNWRAASAVFAAGVVFGLFMVNYQHMNSSESADFSALQDQAKSDQYNQSSEQKGTLKSEHAYRFDEGQDKNKDLPAQGQKSVGADQTPSTPPDSKSVPGGSAESDNNPSRGKVSKEPIPASTSTDASKKITVPVTEPSKPPAQHNKDKSPKQERGLLPGDRDKDKEKGTVESNVDQPPGTMNFFKIDDIVEAASPDQLYVVKWQANKLSLFSKTADTSKEIQTVALQMKPVSIQWSDDSKQILVTLNDGQEQLIAYAITDLGMASMDPVLFSPNPLNNKQSHSDSNLSGSQDDTVKQSPSESGEETSYANSGG
ncbi:zf-HC2 domain-containing protein [Paenibacillus sp. UMB4589-SE434]|uniref:anti-sigma factor family protein n=1 Tax=Paenibacillus sp. UMB4589-SE434 TaxID=3046314 RepID=UPI00254BF610|nr:zf-HC2 domain-containing protein [Paenibacillus sp. UMB4589-SE434]MDK8181033.1 zf-HC2 domain-containing protein [Paenibacillus sp. UMB4589-SE434]